MYGGWTEYAVVLKTTFGFIWDILNFLKICKYNSMRYQSTFILKLISNKKIKFRLYKNIWLLGLYIIIRFPLKELCPWLKLWFSNPYIFAINS